PLFEEQLVALIIDFGIFALCLVFSELAHGLLKLNLVGTRINLGKKIAFVHELAFLECDTNELAVDATANRYSVEGRDSAKAIKVNGTVTELRGGNHDRHNNVGWVKSSPALASCHRCVGYCIPAYVYGLRIFS